MVSNFVGICFARTLHYQFYCWYFHSLPYLLLQQQEQVAYYSISIAVLLLVAIEMAFLTYPATPLSSALLQISHMAILSQIRPPPCCWEDNDDKKKSK